jgi:cyclin-dependent kinase
MDETAIDLLTKMVQLEPSKRISAKEALNHPYFNDLRNSGGFHQPANVDIN